MKKLTFSLIEVVIATLILSLSATIAIEMTSSAHMKTYDVESRWAREHLLSMGCEFYLLFGHEAEFPENILPSGYSLSCELLAAEIAEDADDEKYEAINNWILGEYTVRLFHEGEEINSISITKLVPEEIL